MEIIGKYKNTRKIIDKYDFYFRKKLGQNFLISPMILEEIVYGADVTKEDVVIEIGPGIGSLTQFIAFEAKKVVCVEIDKDLIPILNDTLSEFDNIKIINDDVLNINMEELIDAENDGRAVKIIGNLPYYITTPIVTNLLEKELNIDSITVMVQKEVAERMQAKPGSKKYGRLSIVVQYYSQPEIITEVSKKSFMPSPNVDSSVIKLDILKEKRIKPKSEKLFFRIVKGAFAQRRKTLANSLNNACNFNISKDKIKEIIEKAGLKKNIRGEKLTLEDFEKITNLIYEEEFDK